MRIQILIISIVAVIFSLTLSPAGMSSETGRTFADALEILGSAVDAKDTGIFSELISGDVGIDIAGQEFTHQVFSSDETWPQGSLEFQVFDGDELIDLKVTLDEFLFGDNGFFTALDGVTLTHFERVTRGEIQSDALIERWEHGELEIAVVVADECKYNAYVLPDMKWRMTFECLDDNWYLTGIAVRF